MRSHRKTDADSNAKNGTAVAPDEENRSRENGAVKETEGL